jgi:hypothetical protein
VNAEVLLVGHTVCGSSGSGHTITLKSQLYDVDATIGGWSTWPYSRLDTDVRGALRGKDRSRRKQHIQVSAEVR